MSTDSQRLCSCSTQSPVLVPSTESDDNTSVVFLHCNLRSVTTEQIYAKGNNIRMWRCWSTTNNSTVELLDMDDWGDYFTMNCVMVEGKHDLPRVFPLPRAKGDSGHVPGQAELQAVMALSRHWAAHSQRRRHLLSFRRRRAGSCRRQSERKVSAGHIWHLYRTQNHISHCATLQK